MKFGDIKDSFWTTTALLSNVKISANVKDGLINLVDNSNDAEQILCFEDRRLTKKQIKKLVDKLDNSKGAMMVLDTDRKLNEKQIEMLVNLIDRPADSYIVLKSKIKLTAEQQDKLVGLVNEPKYARWTLELKNRELTQKQQDKLTKLI